MNEKRLLSLKKHLLAISNKPNDWNVAPGIQDEPVYFTEDRHLNIPRAHIGKSYDPKDREEEFPQDVVNTLHKISHALPKSISNNLLYNISRWYPVPEYDMLRGDVATTKPIPSHFTNPNLADKSYSLRVKHPAHIPQEVANVIWDHFLDTGHSSSHAVIGDMHNEHTGRSLEDVRLGDTSGSEEESEHLKDFRKKYNIPTGSRLRTHIVNYFAPIIQEWLDSKGKESLNEAIEEHIKNETNPYAKDIGSVILDHLSAAK